MVMKLDKKTRAIVAFSCVCTSYQAAAQLEEVIVTAQKRTESLQDVSVSVSVISGEKLADVAITRIEEMSSYVPNLTLSETAIGTQLFVRGVGSGVNQGFEQSVGTYVDGVYYGRAQLTRSPFFDMERIEVLRGPQVTLFGNNSIGGALSLSTSKPTDEIEGSISVLYEPENNEREYIIVANSPLNDMTSARFAYRKYDFDGYVQNKFLGEEGPDRNFDTARLSFTFDATESLTTTLKLERSTFDTTGRQVAVFGGETNTYGSGSSVSGSSFANSNPDLVAGKTLAEIYNSAPFTALGAPPALQISPDGSSRYSNGEFSTNSTNNATLSASWTLAGGYDISGIFSYVDYKYDENCDCDFSGLEAINYSTAEDFSQKSLEIRFTSPGGETFDFMGGIYIHEDQLAYDDSLIIPEGDNVIATLIRSIYGPIAGVVFGSVIEDIQVPRTFDQDNDQKAVFGQVTWNMSNDFRITAGVRRTHYKKSAVREMIFTDGAGVPIGVDDIKLGTSPFPDFPPIPVEILNVYDSAFSILFGAYRHKEQGVQDRYRNAYNLIAEWDINDSNLLYASKSYGFKAGGFDVRSNAPTSAETQSPGKNGAKTVLLVPGTFAFDEERVEAYELGLKTRITDYIEINTAYFYTEISDLQVSTFDGAVGFNVSNAGKARTQGLELEVRAALTDNLLLTASIATLDFKFLDYKDGPCITSDELLVTNGRDDEVQRNCRNEFDAEQRGYFSDMAGETTIYAADYSGLVSLHYERPVLDSLMFNGSIDYSFSDEYFTNESLSPDMKQDAYGKFNIRLSLSDTDDTWSAALLARNVTDERILGFSNNVPLSASQYAAPTYYGFFEPGRTVALQLRYKF
jgi:iron complex outermembrane recepter protein